MKKYNIQNYIRYKEDLKESLSSLPDYGTDYHKYTRKELVIKFTPLVEAMARKFSTSQQASGVLTILDLLQEGSGGLVKAVDKLDWETLNKSEDKEKTLKSFLSKRIKGSIRRNIDKLRGNIRIPEHKLNEMRSSKDKKMVEMFFNSIFLSIDVQVNDENLFNEIPDKCTIEKEDVLEIITEVNSAYDGLNLSYDDVTQTHIGTQATSNIEFKNSSGIPFPVSLTRNST